jgi:hypothetical protein
MCLPTYPPVKVRVWVRRRTGRGTDRAADRLSRWSVGGAAPRSSSQAGRELREPSGRRFGPADDLNEIVSALRHGSTPHRRTLAMRHSAARRCCLAGALYLPVLALAHDPEHTCVRALNCVLRSGDGVTRLHNRWPSVEPEVGIEPTTYRLQDSHSALPVASTSNDIHQARLSGSCCPPPYTSFRATSGATPPRLGRWLSSSGAPESSSRRPVEPPRSPTAANQIVGGEGARCCGVSYAWGGMFWLWAKTLAGSIRRLRAVSRRQVVGG